MAEKTNLADPEREPTDEELIELSREAFADVPRANEAALRVLRAQIAEERERVLARLAARTASESKP
ncbi:MAG: hypothetical protein M5U28_51995 [Sandaracinaceae bacterium]|nr:hypothetical protein [Sandaracinaceae bacterium]